jgi:D-alanyl-D-alanine carboxypeptidase/D-alanyl-D-alanine-endopeptidase (penicillin-binding protein 4)
VCAAGSAAIVAAATAPASADAPDVAARTAKAPKGAAAVAARTPARPAGLDALTRTLNSWMGYAGGMSSASVVDLDSGVRVYGRNSSIPRIPASVEKLYTTSVLLMLDGPNARLQTRVLGSGELGDDGTFTGNLYLKGGGDPNFGSTGVSVLAAALDRAGVERVRGRVLGDESFFDRLRGPYGLSSSPYVGPLSALAYNGPRWYSASSAASALTAALRRRGISVTGKPGTGTAPSGAEPLASASSSTMAELARQTNVPSNNFKAEMLIKVLGAQHGVTGSTAAGARVVRTTLSEQAKINPAVVDGSGLSRSNRTSPDQVVRLLGTLDGSRPVDVAFRNSLAVAGRSGTLAYRMRGTAAQDRCRGKTGTLSYVSALAGYCTTASGRRFAFAFLMNNVSVSRARYAQDRMAAALAGYRGQE